MPAEAQARRRLNALIDKYEALSAEDRKKLSEADVVHQFINELLEHVLGWPIKDPARFRYELYTQAGRPDLTLLPENGGTIFVEAKKFGVIKQLEQARFTVSGAITPGQLALPGMANDRTAEEQQAINYAFQNNGTWAILTNFEKLRLFNARRDWLVLSFEEPSAYRRDFDLLWQLAYPNVLKGSLDALSNQRHTAEVDVEYLAFINEWREKLARDVLAHPAANPWAFENGELDLPLLRAVVQRYLDRLVLIRFAEDHLVITPGTLRSFYDLRVQSPYTFSMDEFIDRFARRFDENHNSALFAKDVVDEAVFSDDVLLPLVAKLYEARYRAMSPDILGNTYEQYLGKALALDNGSVTTRDNLETRKKQGSYYTPQVIVRYLVDNSLGRLLYGTRDGRPDGEPVEGETRKTAADIRNLRVIDSACGSGSFLIYAYRVLSEFYERELERLNREMMARTDALAARGVSPMDIRIELSPYKAEIERIQDFPRLILETHLYGVDLDPQAAEIAVVNLIMRAMERQHRSKLLPLILNQNVKVGNSLVGLRPDDPRVLEHAEALAKLRALRLALLAAPHGPEQDAVRVELERETAALKALLNAHLAGHFADLERARPFHWGVEFPEVFYDERGGLLPENGFSAVIGNPPWEILKPDLREFYAQFDERIESRLNRREVEDRIEELDREDPRRRALFEAQTTLIERTAAYVRACGDYTRQGRGDTATHKLFLERMYALLRDGGRIGYVVPSGIYTDLGTKDLRELLLNEGNIQYIFSFSNERFFFPGVDHRFKFALLGAQKGPQSEGFWAAFRFNPRVAVAPADLPAFLSDDTNLVFVREATLKRFSPDSLSVMEFQSRRDYELAEKIYDGWPLLGTHLEGNWNIIFTREFDMTNDRSLFNTSERGLPLYEGKSIHQFDSFYGSPQYWLDEVRASTRLAQKNDSGKDYLAPRLAVRAIARSTDIRTLIATIIPPSVFCGNSLLVVRGSTLSGSVQHYVAALMNSFVLDFVLRYKVAANINMFYLYQLPVPRLNPGDAHFDAIVPRAARLTCTRPEFAGLWQDVMGTSWDATQGATGADERQRLRDEIDAIVAHLYGLSRADFSHILGTFPLVFPDNNAGQARRRALLDTYDAWGNLGTPHP